MALHYPCTILVGVVCRIMFCIHSYIHWLCHNHPSPVQCYHSHTSESSPGYLHCVISMFIIISYMTGCPSILTMMGGFYHDTLPFSYYFHCRRTSVLVHNLRHGFYKSYIILPCGPVTGLFSGSVTGPVSGSVTGPVTGPVSGSGYWSVFRSMCHLVPLQLYSITCYIISGMHLDCR